MIVKCVGGWNWRDQSTCNYNYTYKISNVEPQFKKAKEMYNKTRRWKIFGFHCPQCRNHTIKLEKD